MVLYGYKHNHEHNELDNQQHHGGAGTLNLLSHKNISDHNNSTR